MSQIKRRRRRRRQGVRKGAYLALGLVAIAVFLLWSAERPPRDPDDLCAIFFEKRHWYLSARSSFETWGVPEAVLMAVIYQESSFLARSQSPRRKLLWILPGRRSSSAYGYAQALDPTWQEYRDRTGRNDARRDDFEDAAHFVGWYSSEIHRLTGIEKDDATLLYLAYHEGPGGYARGTHLGKTWLLETADRVGMRAQNYQRQYDLCEESLRRRRSWWRWSLAFMLVVWGAWSYRRRRHRASDRSGRRRHRLDLS